MTIAALAIAVRYGGGGGPLREKIEIMTGLPGPGRRGASARATAIDTSVTSMTRPGLLGAARAGEAEC